MIINWKYFLKKKGFKFSDIINKERYNSYEELCSDFLKRKLTIPTEKEFNDILSSQIVATSEEEVPPEIAPLEEHSVLFESSKLEPEISIVEAAKETKLTKKKPTRKRSKVVKKDEPDANQAKESWPQRFC